MTGVAELGAFDFFGPPPLAGLAITSELMSPAEEAGLIARIDNSDLSPFKFQRWLGKRLTRSYGPGYDFESGRVAVSEPVPDWLRPIRSRAADFAGLDAAALVQVLLIRYGPGAGIGWHRDRPSYEQVIGVSLGAPALLRFRRRSATGFDRINLPLAPRSAYLLSGDARYAWEHSIAPIAETRWSLTFRTLSASGLVALSRAGLAGD